MSTLPFLIFCLFICIPIVSTTEKIKSAFIQLAMECNKEHPISTQEFEMLKQHKFPNTKNTKCLQACVFKRMNWMNDKGMFDEVAAYQTSEKENTDAEKLVQVKNLLNECKKVNDETFSDGESGCERASVLAKCLTENSIKLGFL